MRLSTLHYHRHAGMSSREGVTVLGDELFESRRRPTTNRFDQVVCSSEDPVLVVDGDLAQVPDEERIARPAVWRLFKLTVQGPGGMLGGRLLAARGHDLKHCLKAHLLVLDVLA